ncbi:hypothetical protein MMC14_009175 [Varicellaria rhodocarpa]|nr:hypothetical protein [Varicellaria rhodocarpa]
MPHIPNHVANQAWTYRIPSPPRIPIPHPLLDASGLPILASAQNADSEYGFEIPHFLNPFRLMDLVKPDNMLNWRYEQRREAQAILPFLYLGPLSAAKDFDFLRREGITMIMAVRKTSSAQTNFVVSRVASELGISTISMDVASYQELIAAFPRAIEAINLHLSSIYNQQQIQIASTTSPYQQVPNSIPGRVLVFCESGNERSAAVVAAYMIQVYSFTLVDSLQILTNQRFCVTFDDNLKTLMHSYELIVQAKRDVLRGQRAQLQSRGGQAEADVMESGRNGKSSKRTLDETFEDVEMDEGYRQTDRERFEDRKGNAPFEDGGG